MFDRLRRRKETGIEGGRALEFLHNLLALLDDAHDGIASLASRRFADFLKHLFESSHVLFGLGLMFLEGGVEILGLGRLRHFRQG